MVGISGSNIVEPRSQASPRVTNTNAAKENWNLFPVASDENTDAPPRGSESVTKHAGTWASTAVSIASAEIFEEDIDSYSPRQAPQPSISDRPQDEQITLQAAYQKQNRASNSKRDRVKEWLRHSGPRMLHVTATTAMEMEASEDSAALKSEDTNDWERSNDHDSDANGCESTCRANSEEGDMDRAE
ncbi:uncharacterized protein RHO25_005638 [Cercospora beticola]|uniref:Uncharacterized protein n=1 Tax=Cercospora beticola TaxID=122368 RepID=A0ABZ0NND7_CERBT|nr:hypothetical protein RHO25_005638 [Cercospora beticola]